MLQFEAYLAAGSSTIYDGLDGVLDGEAEVF